MPEPEQPQGEEPDDHYRAENPPDGFGAFALKPKKTGENDRSNGRDVGSEGGTEALQAFGRAEHRNGGGDDAIAIEERGTDQNNQHGEADLAVGFRRIGFGVTQGEEGENPAFAAVVGAHDEADVFETHDEEERPRHEREDAEYALGALAGCELREALLHGVEGARANVAKDDAERTHAQRGLCPSLDWRSRGSTHRKVEYPVSGGRLQAVLWVGQNQLAKEDTALAGGQFA